LLFGASSSSGSNISGLWHSPPAVPGFTAVQEESELLLMHRAPNTSKCSANRRKQRHNNDDGLLLLMDWSCVGCCVPLMIAQTAQVDILLSLSRRDETARSKERLKERR